MALVPPQNFTNTDNDVCYLEVTFKDGVTRYFKFNPVELLSGKYYWSEITLGGFGTSLSATIKTWGQGENNSGYLK